jgi:hypothetical protein
LLRQFYADRNLTIRQRKFRRILLDLAERRDADGLAQRYGGYTLRSPIEAPLITREVLPETYFLLVIMAADAQARPFLQFQASC